MSSHVVTKQMLIDLDISLGAKKTVPCLRSSTETATRPAISNLKSVPKKPNN